MRTLARWNRSCCEGTSFCVPGSRASASPTAAQTRRCELPSSSLACPIRSVGPESSNANVSCFLRESCVVAPEAGLTGMHKRAHSFICALFRPFHPAANESIRFWAYGATCPGCWPLAKCRPLRPLCRSSAATTRFMLTPRRCKHQGA